MTKKMILALSLFALLFSGCKKDEATGTVDTMYMSVKIDGIEKQFSAVNARWVDGGNFLEITGSNGSMEWLTITVMSENTRVSNGRYSLDTSGPNMLGIYAVTKDNQQLNVTATGGTHAPEDALNLEITRINNSSVEGSFSGAFVSVEGLNTLKVVPIANGKFKTEIKAN
ncbi:hypothetical protein [Sphingobacterium paucimobilis]|nr:hypothetical protein [Sphingobacterium paucimobilis]